MEGEALVNGVMAAVSLLFLASISALILKRLRFPYTVGLVVLGVVLAAFGKGIPAIGEPITAFRLGPELIMFVFIPVLIFESAINANVRLLLGNLGPTGLLAGPGLLLSAALIGFSLSLLIGLPIGSAIILGILISATDPVAVIALFSEVGAPKRLTILVEGESLLNDATAIVAYTIGVGVVAAGVFDGSVILGGLLDFVVVFIGGLIVGLGFGYLLVLSIRTIGDEPLVQISLTAVVAYGAFIVSEHFLHTSGVMAVLGAGLVVGYHGTLLYSDHVREQLEVFWENVAFIANSFIFLLLGLSVLDFLANVVANPVGLALPAAVAVVVVMVVRALVVFGVVNLGNRLPIGRPVPFAYQQVMFWGGLRGAVAVALALSLPTTFPFRWQIIDITFAVTLTTLLINGTTMAWLLRRLGLDQPTKLNAFLAAEAERRAKTAARDRLEADRSAGLLAPGVTARVQAELAAEAAVADRRLREAREAFGDDPDTPRRLLWLLALATLDASHQERFDGGLLELAAFRELEWDTRDHERRVLEGDGVAECELAGRLDAQIWGRRLPTGRTASISGPRIGWVPRFGERRIRLLHEQLSATYVGARAVQSDLDRLVDLAAADGDDRATVDRYFEELKQRSADQLASLERRVGSLGADMAERQLRRLARDGEAEARRAAELPAELPPRLAIDLEGS